MVVKHNARPVNKLVNSEWKAVDSGDTKEGTWKGNVEHLFSDTRPEHPQMNCDTGLSIPIEVQAGVT